MLEYHFPTMKSILTWLFEYVKALNLPRLLKKPEVSFCQHILIVEIFEYQTN